MIKRVVSRVSAASVVLCAFVSFGSVAAAEPITSQYWKNYINSRVDGSDLRALSDSAADRDILPNFSYAGYGFGEEPLPTVGSPVGYDTPVPEFDSVLLNHKIFDVTSFGAIANDAKSDKQAVKGAVAAAEAYVERNATKGAIIYFPPGRFLLNEAYDMASIPPAKPSGKGTDTDRVYAEKHQPIYIRKSNIIVRGSGSGSGSGGTVLYMDHHFVAKYSDKMWTTPSLFRIGRFSGPSRLPQSTKITAAVKRDTTKTVTVENTQGLSPGQWVMLRSVDARRETLERALSPYKPEPEFRLNGKAHWKELYRGLDRREIHQIVGIRGKQVSFQSPIHSDIEVDIASEDFDWRIEYGNFDPIENVGFENLVLEGGWADAFEHHKNYVHDSGWSALELSEAVNSWVKSVTFTSWNTGLQIRRSASVTVQDVLFNGNPGHLSLGIMHSSQVLAINVYDEANSWHAPGVSHFSAMNVLLNSHYQPTSSPNIHASQPRKNLFDKIKGGWIHGRWGGAIGNNPNHLKQLVFWNPENTSPAEVDWAFMQLGDYGRIITPYVIGMHGNVHRFAVQQIYVDYAKSRYFGKGNNPYSTPLGKVSQAIEESPGTPVKPYSLYEAQLKQRLGRLPEWLLKATGKVRHLKFVALSVEADKGVPAKGSLLVLDQMGYPINENAWHVSFTADIQESVIDLGDYYEPSAINYTPDPGSTGCVSTFEIFTSLDGVTWDQAVLFGSFERNNHEQVILGDKGKRGQETSKTKEFFHLIKVLLFPPPKKEGLINQA